MIMRIFPQMWLAGLCLTGTTIMWAQTVSITEYPMPTAPVCIPGTICFISITAGPDGALWYTGSIGNNIGRVTTEGIFTEYPSQGSGAPEIITQGPDGALWFSEIGGTNIGRITTSGTTTVFTVPYLGEFIQGLAAGPDGALWFSQNFKGPFSGATPVFDIARITTSGVVTQSQQYQSPNGAGAVAWGPDGALWFGTADSIGRMTTTGEFTYYPLPTANTSAGPIISGPDGAMWFIEASKIGRITTTGVITEYPVPNNDNFIDSITTGPDGALWFTLRETNLIGRITTAGVVTEYPLPTANAEPEGIAMGPDGALWFTENAGKIGRLVVVQTDPFFNGEQTLSNGVDYLQFQDGSLFGYYAPLADSSIIYHFDLGYEAVLPSGDTVGDVYLLDYQSGHWWYTGPNLFPYLYDFTLGAWIYYEPDPSNPGHYTTGPRKFAYTTTHMIFTM